MENNDADVEGQLLQNALLFNVIRKNKTSDEKLQKITKYIGRGADINAVDANNKQNTPLHVAVSKGEIEVVTFLLDRGASATSKNSNNETALDIAQKSETFNGSKIANILKLSLIENQAYSQKQIKEQFNLGNITEQLNKHQLQKQCILESKTAKKDTQNYYHKISGTSGLGGQLYETKLLSLILIRALYSDKITKFFLGTNVEGMGAFDDIIFRYNLKGIKKTKIIFLQAKHREDPTKDKVTVDDVLKQNGDFSLHKYLDSYIKICRKFSSDNNDSLFKGIMKDIDCEFIIFTSAMENFTKKKIIDQSDGDYFIKNNTNGKIFQFDYDERDIEFLVQTVSRLRTVSLAKRLCQFILKDNNNYKNMMMDDLIKTFHVFLVQNVITLETTQQDLNSKDAFVVGKLQQKFLASNEELLLLMKSTICKEIYDITKSSDQLNKVDVQSLTFKLPVNFGNVKFCLSGSIAKKQRRLNYLCSKFIKLIQNGNSIYDSKYILIKVDESIIGPNKVLQATDIEPYRLGGLVGNLLTFDDETKLLMFNHDVQNLSEDNLKLFELLKEELIDLSRYRFDINISQFPKLSLAYEKYDRNLVIAFLNNLKFYTNQGKEDEVENIVKEEIDKFCNINNTQNESLFKIKCDAIFLKVHDKIQKWWKRSVRAPYLTETCQFYQEAQKDILESPLLSFLNIIYRENMKNILAKFVSVTIESLKIETFLQRAEKTLVIFSNEINFSCIKLIQYFDVKDSEVCLFLDLDFVIIENYFEMVQSELRKSKVEVLTVVCQKGTNMTKKYEKINVLTESFKGKIIIVTKSSLRDNLETVLCENIIQEIDNENSLNDLAGEYREMILVERKILFQGNELSLDNLLNSESLHLVKANVLRKIINNERIEIGKTLTSPSYDAIANFYIAQSICRYITMDIKKEINDDFYIIENGKSEHVPHGTADVIFVSEIEKEYEDICRKYKRYNVHWFSSESSCYVWKKSQGSIEGILRYVTRGSHNDYIKRPKTLKDIHEKIVVISAEPGMGKSTLLTHLAIQTKRIYPTLWIAKINLLEHIDQFNKWKENHTFFNMKEALKFLYTAISTNFVKGIETGIQNMKIYFEKLVSQISIDKENNICLLNNEKQKDLCELGWLEINLFSYFYNKNSVILLFDGFDEICPDYAEEVIHLLCTLKTSKVAHLWVTTRSYNVLHELEINLGTFSFTLKALTPCEQETFLQKIWSSKTGFDDATWISKCVKMFYEVIRIALRDDDRSFTSLPLHLNMVSEVFLDYYKYLYLDIDTEHAMDYFNLISLYNTFVDMKFFKIRFGEKKHFMCFKDPDLRKMVEKERKTFLENHKKTAAYFFFAKSVVKGLFSEQEIMEVQEFIKSVKSGEEKSGIIEHIVDENPKFVHITFAEYFATEFLFDKFRSEFCNSALQKYVLNVIFSTDKGGVRRFINSKLIIDKTEFYYPENTAYMCRIFDTLVSQNCLPSNSFIVASEEYLDNFVVLYCIVKKLHEFLRCHTSEHNLTYEAKDNAVTITLV